MLKYNVEVKQLMLNPKQYADKECVVSGWARTIRDQKAFAFIALQDGSYQQPLQLVVNRENVANYDELVHQGTGTAYTARGKIVLTPNAKQPLEMQVKEIVLVGDCPSDFPLQPKRHTVEYLRTIPHLRMRTNLLQAVFRVRSEAAFAIHEFFHSRDFLYIHTPLITTNDAEGAGEMFQVTSLDLNNLPLNEAGKVDYTQDFFNKKTYLTVTGQLHAEAFAQCFKNVYTFGPTFRAENSNTTRHAAEFWMIEPEISFADIEDAMNLAEDMLKHIIKRVLERCPSEMQMFNQFVDKGLLERLEHVANSNFARITYTEAIDLLKKADKKFKYAVDWGCDIQTEHERYLSEEVFKSPVFVTDYPSDIKAFYMRQNEDGKTVAAFDCLVPGVGEIVGGSQREERLERLEQAYLNKDLNVADYAWYNDLRRFGSTPHAGYGLGFERILMYLTGVSNIRDVELFPRTAGNAMY